MADGKTLAAQATTALEWEFLAWHLVAEANAYHEAVVRENGELKSLLACWLDWASSLQYSSPEMEQYWWDNQPGQET